MDERFYAWLDGRRRWKLHAWHPFLIPAKEGGELDVTEPRTDVVLKLEEGPSISFTPIFASERTLRGFAVLLLKPGRADAIESTSFADERDGIGRFTPVPNGSYDVLIDPKDARPLLLRDVAFDGSPRDLGRLDFARGSTLTLKPVSKTKRLAGACIAFAEPLEPPRFARQDFVDDVSENLSLRGLPAGRVRVRVRATLDHQWKDATPIEVEVDGEHDREIEVPVD
jgi:hypothetical protein